ncbi:CBS domain-containing protein [Flavobacterium aquicola]|uniref:CBS domain protein n=1 Tax=Flavobacterium aquicola TaxID=1682742 RepID=A0A3E0ER44_9FLAO|nr:CBS domain-containing protein [Flavobacterium aquicola]REH00201.1 CBS domain protein [Flavobacterium aquicola]
MTVNQILRTKGAEVYSIISTITVFEALRVMGEKNIGAVLVIENGELKGILSERDYARKIVLKDKSSKKTPVSEIMECDVVTVKPSDDLEFCMEIMSKRRIRHLPVIENGSIIGLVSIGDVVKAIIEVQKETIKHLDSYISR